MATPEEIPHLCDITCSKTIVACFEHAVVLQAKDTCIKCVTLLRPGSDCLVVHVRAQCPSPGSRYHALVMLQGDFVTCSATL